MGNYINRRSLIDAETGEIIRETNWVGYDGFTETGYKYRSRQCPIKYFPDSIPSNLSQAAWYLLFMMAEIMNDENVLVYRVDRKSKFSTILYKPYDKEDIRTKIRYPYGQNKFDRCWQELSKHCLKRVQYYNYLVWAVNPAVISKSKEIPYWLCAEFKDYLIPHMSAISVKKLQNKIDNLD